MAYISTVNRDTKTLDRFVGAVFRRYVVLRIVECAGLGLLAGCAADAVFVGILLWLGQEGWAVAGAFLGVGALAGAGWGILSRPTKLAAAIEADRQLLTTDLFATAWGLEENLTDPWQRSVVALATAHCKQVAPAAVLLHRLGVRAWGGIALAVAFVSILAVMSSETTIQTDTSPPHASTSFTRSANDPSRRPIIEMTVANRAAQGRVDQTPGETEAHRQTASETSNATDEETLEETASRADDPDANARSASVGTGASAGQTKRSNPTPPEQPPIAASPLRPAPSSASDHTGGGTGRAAKDPVAAEAGGGGTFDQAPTRPLSAAPWRLQNWPKAVESAMRDVRGGRVPDDYRNLVRGYFDLSSAPEAEQP